MRQIDSPKASSSGSQAGPTTWAGLPGVRSRRGRALAALLAALTVTATLVAVGPATGLDGNHIGPPNGLGFPQYYTDDTGLALALCIDGTASCDGVTRAVLRDTTEGEAFYWMAVAALPTRRGTLDVELALEAAWDPPGTPVVFDRLRVRGHLNRAGRYVLQHPYGQQVVIAGSPTEQRNVNLTIDRPCSLVQGACGQITDFLRSTSFPVGYIGMGEATSRVVGGSERNWVSLLSATGRRLGTTRQFGVIGKVAGARAGVIAPTRVEFGNTARPRTRSLRIHSAGSEPLTISGVRMRGARGVVRQRGGCRPGDTVAVGSSCRVTMVYKPGRRRVVRGALVVTDDSQVTRHRVPIAAATAPEASAPASVRFRARRVRTASEARTIRVRNTGVRVLRIAGVSMRGRGRRSFDLVPGEDRCRRGQRVAPRGSCSLHVRFAPRGARTWSARLLVRSNGLGSPTSVHLSGRGRRR